MKAIIGRKLGMTRVFDEDGRAIPVTVIEAGPCPVVQVREAAHGQAVQIGFGVKKATRTSKALSGHVGKAGLEVAPARIAEFTLDDGDAAPNPGDTITVEIFESGEHVKITGITKGRGFTGVVVRWNHAIGPKSHGSKSKRILGSIGMHQDPGRMVHRSTPWHGGRSGKNSV